MRLEDERESSNVEDRRGARGVGGTGRRIGLGTVAIALIAFGVSNAAYRKTLVALAALAIATSGLIGGFHAGVEYGYWEGLTACTATISGSGDDLIKSIMNAPLVRCDVAPWTLFGISLAGYNFLLSFGGAMLILAMIWRRKKI